MKLCYIISNSLKRKIYDYKNFGIMVVFPIILTFIFAAVFGNMNKSIKEENHEKTEIVAGIYSEEKTLSRDLTKFLDELKKDNQVIVSYKLITDKKSAQSSLKNNQIDVLTEINQEDNIYLSSRAEDSEKRDVLKGILVNFTKNRALYSIADSKYLKSTPLNSSNEKNFIKRDIEESDKNFNVISIAATMISFAVLMAGSYGSSAVYYIRKPVGRRVQTAPVSKNVIYLGEYAAGVMMTFIQGSIIALICDFFLQIGYRNNIFQMAEVILFLSIMSVAIGVCIGAVIKNEKLSGGIVSIILMILCFTSGGFMPNVDLGAIVKFSPVTVINQAIVGICMGQEAENIMLAFSVTFGLTILCLIIAVFKINVAEKEAE